MIYRTPIYFKTQKDEYDLSKYLIHGDHYNCVIHVNGWYLLHLYDFNLSNNILTINKCKRFETWVNYKYPVEVILVEQIFDENPTLFYNNNRIFVE